MQHKIRWDPGVMKWFCVNCGHSSDHGNQVEASREIADFDCTGQNADGKPALKRRAAAAASQR